MAAKSGASAGARAADAAPSAADTVSAAPSAAADAGAGAPAGSTGGAATDPAAARRPQDAVASSSRTTPLADGSHRFAGYVSHDGAHRSSNFDADSGCYTASVDGQYFVSAAVSGSRLPPDVGFVTLVHRHSAAGTTVHTHVEPFDGGLTHLRTSDTLCVVASPAESGPAAAARLVGALAGLEVSLRIELAMRKRKRMPDLADLCEAEAEAEAAARRKRGAAAPADDEGTGSDTEWSEGFSSDDEARREARPPKRVRLLTRAARELECETTEAEPGDGAT